jgi:UTP--glucose-1-phosphate uridylyltransferase
VHRVPGEQVERYGIVDGEEESAGVFRLRRLVEKPRRRDAPSDLAIAGCYVLTPGIFACLDRLTPGAGGELQLSDAVNLLAESEPVYALAWKARRHDLGDRVGYARYFTELAMRRPDTAGPVREHVRRLLRELDEEE